MSLLKERVALCDVTQGGEVFNARY